MYIITYTIIKICSRKELEFHRIQLHYHHINNVTHFTKFLATNKWDRQKVKHETIKTLYPKTIKGAILKRRPHGGGGGLENFPILWTNSTDRLCEMRMRGGKGVQNSENFADVF